MKAVFKWKKIAEWRRKLYHDRSLSRKIEIKKQAYIFNNYKKNIIVDCVNPVYKTTLESRVRLRGKTNR